MYSICTVVHGWDLTGRITDSDTLAELEELEVEGFQFLYHGSSDHQPASFGVDLCEFDEGTTSVAKLKIKPSEKDKAELAKLVKSFARQRIQKSLNLQN
jgi:hypothetical protein